MLTIKSTYIRSHLEKFNRQREEQIRKAHQSGHAMLVALYLRVSTYEQVDGYSLDAQERDCLAFAERKGWEIYKIYRDDGFSGTNDKRPAFRMLKRDARSQKFQVVLTHKIDRTYRNAQGMLKVFAEWQSYGILFASVREDLDFSTVWGKLMLGILSLMAEWFSNNLSEETHKGLYGRHLKGLHNGPIPWGYCRGNCSTCTDVNGEGYCPHFKLEDLNITEHVIPHPVDSIAFLAAHKAYCTGNYSDRDIAEFLNNFQVPTPDGDFIQVRSRGKQGKQPAPFTKDMVNDLLQSVFYTGRVPFYGSKITGRQVVKYTHYRKIETGQHAPLISDAQYDHAMDVRKLWYKAPRGKGAVRNASRIYILQGLLDCARCGEALHAQAGGGNARRHICSTRLQRKGVCDQKSVKADVPEAEFNAQMDALELPTAWQEEILAYLITEEGLDTLISQRQALDDHFNEIQYQYDNESILRRDYLREKQFYYRQLKNLSLDNHKNINLKHAQKLLADFPALWKQMTLLEKKGIAQSLLKVGVYDNQTVIEWQWYKPFRELFAY